MVFNRDDETNWYFSDLNFTNTKVPKGIRTIGELEEYANKNELGYISETRRYTPDGRKLEDYQPNYYFYCGDNYKNEKNSIQCEMIFGKTKKEFRAYWLNSTNVWVNFEDNCVNYCFGLILDGFIDPRWLYDSYHSANTVSFGDRPIVILNSNIEIDTENSGDGSTSTLAWKLK